MIECGSIKVEKKISILDLLNEIEEIAKSLGEEYKIAFGSIDTEGYFIGPRRLKISDTEIVVGLNKLSSLRIHLGTRVGIIVCRDTTKKISLLVLKKDEKVPDEIMNTIVNRLTEFTGGIFDGSV